MRANIRFVSHIQKSRAVEDGRNFLLAAKVIGGWGPRAHDWEERKTPFLCWLYRRRWNGRCPRCGGEGRLNKTKGRNEEGVIKTFRHVACPDCVGTGADFGWADAF